MKNKYMMMGLFLAASEASNYHAYNVEKRRNPVKENKPSKPIIPKGANVFIIEGVEILAINEKNAIRKFKKLRNEQQ